ncbi:NADPH-dependent glutamate synthase [Desulfurispirillum indicum]|uniref:Glutamate synthase (NADPH), homotetrameric n=1 Tax=Desulfurispirillum indicum (strain ATCC BAA-1389 / DSM 22839 / S5) TaxID=653733 RepID=E6W0M9_DESIS|nr:NADPH-dependent glutamate synthase [Desulfurispirillum indicum]ADU65281.1 glutamate synthase (NADPH), homotetrameric [Desulfurispirillum indicum S5]UCZ57179.1 NADPH-dependent glutamate synthase [Desulfurispirillum indicum]
MAELTPKERMAIERHPMPEQRPEDRVKNFDEVPLGFAQEVAMREAARCLDCKSPQCVEGCPVSIDIPGFLKLIEKGDFKGSVKKIRETNFLPAICGRVCPQDQQCELVCIVGKRGKPVAIGSLERWISDYERENKIREIPEVAAATGKKIAVVGSGPAGMTAAYEIRKRGHDVTVFEAFHRGGGVLVYGIPRFRLPLSVIDEDLNFLEKMGVKFIYNTIVGKSMSLDDLLGSEWGFDAVFVGTGAGLPKMTGVPGENLNGVYSANEYLTRVYLMGAGNFPDNVTPLYQGKKVGIIGAGNTAMDAARTAKRLGADVTLYYRRSEEEAPARTEELHHAKEEFINFKFLSNPVEFIGDDNFFIKQIKCDVMKLGEPDDSGRRKPEATGESFIDDCDTAIMALGCDVNPIIPTSTPEIEVNKWGVVVADPETGATSKKAVFAGGDLITGGSTVINAMGQAKRAAAALHDFVMEQGNAFGYWK